MITVEGIGNVKSPHPAQERIAMGNGSQCGFCTPGIVMVSDKHKLEALKITLITPRRVFMRFSERKRTQPSWMLKRLSMVIYADVLAIDRFSMLHNHSTRPKAARKLPETEAVAVAWRKVRMVAAAAKWATVRTVTKSQ